MIAPPGPWTAEWFLVAAPAAWYDPSFVTPFSLVVVCLAVLALIVGGLWPVARDRLSRDAVVTAGATSRVRETTLWLAGLFCVSFAAKVYTLHELPSPIPYLDQWVAEAGGLYIPYSEGHLPWRALFALHNEHRIFFTRLMALGLLSGNGQWDPLLQQLANAVLHSATGVLLAATLWLSRGRRRLDLVVLACGLALVPPFAWENTILGFQSAFYFLLLFSVLALWLTWRYPVRSWPWALGWICALCALFSSAGGVLTVGVAAVAALYRAWRSRESWTRSAVALSVPGVLLILGAATKSPPLPMHAALSAATLADFVAALSRNLAWPWIDHPGWLVWVWIPLTALLVRVLRRRGAPMDHEAWLLILGFWVVLQAAALAYGRGARTQPLSARYMDFLSLGLVANIVALGEWLDTPVRSRVVRAALLGSIGIWLAFCAAGIDRVTRRGLIDGRGVRQWEVNWGENLRHFVLTDDLAQFTTKHFPVEVPYSDPQVLATAWLRNPYIRQILPGVVHEPLRIEPALVTNDGFAVNGVYPTTPVDPLRPAWGSFTAQQNPAQGHFESAPFPGCPGYVRIEVAGYLGERGLSLGLRSVGSSTLIPIEPDGLARETWVPVIVRCPGGPFTIVATDANARFWFAFRSPVVVAWASGLARELVDQAPALAGIVTALALVGLRFSGPDAPARLAVNLGDRP